MRLKILIINFFLFPLLAFAQPTASFSLDKPTGIYCFGDTIKITNTSTNYTICHWTFGDGTDTWTTNPLHIYQATGNYTINLVVTDNSNVSSNTFLQVTINQTPNVNIVQDKNLMTLTAQASGGTTITFQWSFDNTPTAETNPQIFYFEDGYYSVVATNENQCSDSTGINVTINGTNSQTDDTLQITVVNNMLTPDMNDGINDMLFIQGLSDYTNACLVNVYNKWGQLVYTNANYTNLGGFDGHSSAGKVLDSGTYYYIIQSSGRKTATGYIDLIR